MFHTLKTKIAIAAMAAVLCSAIAGQAGAGQGSSHAVSRQDAFFYDHILEVQKPLIAPLKLTNEQKANIDRLVRAAAHSRATQDGYVFGPFYAGLQKILTREQYTKYMEASCKPIAINQNKAILHGGLLSQTFQTYSDWSSPQVTFQWQQAIGSTQPNKCVGPDGGDKTYWTEPTHTVAVPPGPITVRVRGVDEQGHTSDWTTFTTVLTIHSPQQQAANINARALATAVQAKAVQTDRYDTNLADYTIDFGGSIPINPCTGTTTGYTITTQKGKTPDDATATVSANKGTKCGDWTPTTYRLSL